MIFTTTKKKLEDKEKYPNHAVITQDGTTFSLNKKAMEVLGYELNKANVNFITNGFDEENNLVVANLKLDGAYTNNITAKNTFSSSKFAERIKSQFDTELAEFELVQAFEEDGVKYAYVELLAYGLFEDNDSNLPEIESAKPSEELPPLPEEIIFIESGPATSVATDENEQQLEYSDYKEEVSSRPMTQAEIIKAKASEW